MFLVSFDPEIWVGLDGLAEDLLSSLQISFIVDSGDVRIELTWLNAVQNSPRLACS